MSNKNRGPRPPSFPDIERTAVREMRGEEAPKKLELMTIRADRIDFAAQEQTIIDMYDEGYEHYETFILTNAEIALRFRRFVDRSLFR